MVGYGLSGDGINGYTVSPSFRVKRSGQNVFDLFDLDDEQNFLAGAKEVWYADFDGGGQDSFCTLLSVCTPKLANDKETTLGGGDSGGPSFMLVDGQYVLVANNTFGGTLSDDQVDGTFGTFMGGIVLSSYVDYLEGATNSSITVAVPEPETYALMLAGLGRDGHGGAPPPQRLTDTAARETRAAPLCRRPRRTSAVRRLRRAALAVLEQRDARARTSRGAR